MTRSMAATTVEGMADECICYVERQVGGLLSLSPSPHVNHTKSIQPPPFHTSMQS